MRNTIKCVLQLFSSPEVHRDLDIHGLNPRTLIRAARRAAVNSAEARRRIAYECSAGQDETESRLASDHAEKFLPAPERRDGRSACRHEVVPARATIRRSRPFPGGLNRRTAAGRGVPTRGARRGRARIVSPSAGWRAGPTGVPAVRLGDPRRHRRVRPSRIGFRPRAWTEWAGIEASAAAGRT